MYGNWQASCIENYAGILVILLGFHLQVNQMMSPIYTF